jgi:2,5-dioxopentanoate dehydrogenase
MATTTAREPILLAGEWKQPEQWTAPTKAGYAFRSADPTTGEPFGPEFQASEWSVVDAALSYASQASLPFAPAARRAEFLEHYATLIDDNASSLSEIAARETGLPADARFQTVEIPRTTNQLRQAAATARTGDWSEPTIDSKANIRSCLAPIGPVAIFGPVNFPFAYNAIAGGDFASAIAAGNVVIGKAHPSHPQTTLALAQLLVQASRDVGVAPPAQLLYGFDGLRLAKDKRLAAIGFTGSRAGGLALKAACDTAGIPFYGELSSINPLVITAAALSERFDQIVDQYVASVLMAGGQMCTNPGLVFLIESEASTRFIDVVVSKFASTPPPVLLNDSLVAGLAANVERVVGARARLLCGGKRVGPGFRFENTLLHASDADFAKSSTAMQTEMFGPACLMVTCANTPSITRLVAQLDGQLCGSVYLAANESPLSDVQELLTALRRRVGRLLVDKMPTGVAVSPAMNHGGPYPATGHAGFTAVGFPAAVRRFAKLDCYDNVRHELLPPVLRNENPTGAWRFVDGNWTREAIIDPIIASK